MEEKPDSITDNDFEIIKKDMLKIEKKISAIRFIKPKDPKFLEKLESYQKTLPRGAEIGPILDEVSKKLKDYIESSNKNRLSFFRPLINQYINSLQGRNIVYRMIDNTLFRVGCLEIETQPEKGNIRILFNKNTILPWTPVREMNDIESSIQAAHAKLKEMEVPLDEFSRMLHYAYHKVRARQEKERKPNPDYVMLKPLHSEILVELFKRQLKGKKNLNVKMKDIFFPDWAFLYNLDLYRAKLSQIPEEKRLLFETGSQSETEKYGVVLNGLTAQSEYKKFCYLRGR